MQNYSYTLFQDAFDTFKAFDNLSLKETGPWLLNAPKTIWQILNHITAWQAYQITALTNMVQPLDESTTWIFEENASTQKELDAVAILFKQQLAEVKSMLLIFDMNDSNFKHKLKLVQDLSVHLSFHIGEVILIRRMEGNYPLPHEMKAFLS